MVNFKNTVVGFLVSFVGSIPLGYLNIIGYDIYLQQGINATVVFLLGVILVEFFVIYFTLVFADRLAANQKLTQYIEGFSVVFMFVLAFIFYAGSAKVEAQGDNFSQLGYWKTFTSGIFLSLINFAQLPFWTGWNLFLVNGKYIEVSEKRKYFYVVGTVMGTFCGMLALILSLNFLTGKSDFLSQYLMKFIIPGIFAVLGIVQGIRFYRKYR